MDAPELLTFAEVAERYGLPKNTIERAPIQRVRINDRVIRLRRADVERWLASHLEEAV